MTRPAYHCFLPSELAKLPSELAKQPEPLQFWLAWGAVWAVLGPILCVALMLDYWRCA